MRTSIDEQWKSMRVPRRTGMRLQIVWSVRAAIKIPHNSGSLTFSEIATRAKQDISSSWRQTPYTSRIKETVHVEKQ
ncbi:hypothetical protein TNCV_1350131 [Trichonephila clavipes]|nr:hypothetical protein TNCV_1350131 [Trichonephila clavipes]